MALSAALRESLAERTAEVVTAVVQVDSASTFLTAPPAINPTGPLLTERTHEARAVSVPTAPGHGYGYER